VTSVIMPLAPEDYVDLASERLGGAAVAANDEFFASKENLIKPAAAVWRDGVYTDRGKWMDGWETRRRRDGGDHDWCVVRLGVRGHVMAVDVDTSFFTGNYPESCAVDACDLSTAPMGDFTAAPWREIIRRSPLSGDAHNRLDVAAPPDAATHLRLRIFPDGGVARFRVYGLVAPDWERLRRRGEVDLAAVENGGLVVACSDSFFGSRHNLIMPGDSSSMADGWETKRRRGPGHDWTIIRLGAAGTIRRVEVDTRHFKGNAPGACSLEVTAIDEVMNRAKLQDDRHWVELVARTALEPHARHTFQDDVREFTGATFVRFNIFPDGGVARLRLFGTPL
jgi:allantoicase